MTAWIVKFITSIDKRVHHSRVSVFQLKFRLFQLVISIKRAFPFWSKRDSRGLSHRQITESTANVKVTLEVLARRPAAAIFI